MQTTLPTPPSVTATGAQTSTERGRSAISPLSLGANFRWTFAGNVVNALSQWGVLAVLARMASAGAVGQFVLGLSIAAPVMSFAMLQLRHVQVTDARGEFPFADYFGTRIAWTLVGLAVIGACIVVGQLEPQTAWVVLAVGLAKCADSLADIVRGLFQHHERMDYSGISMMLKGPPALAAVALLTWWTGDIVAGVFGMAVVWFASFAAYDLVTARRVLRLLASAGGGAERLAPRFGWGSILRLSWIALPLGIVMGLISLQPNIPRYVVQGYWGEEALGYFGALVYPVVAATLVITALGQSASPRLARHYLDDLPAYRALLRKLLLLGAGLGTAMVVGTLLLSGPVLTLLYGSEYAAYGWAFVVVAVAGAIQMMTSAWGYGLTAARVFRMQVLLVGVACVAAAIAAFVFVPRWGVMGAAVSMLVTSVVSCLAFGLAIRWTVDRSVNASHVGDAA